MPDRNILLHRNIRIETGSRSKYEGHIDFMDEIGLMFIPDDSHLNHAFITWGDIRKIFIIKELKQ